jgi:YfiH family protein
MPLIQADGLKFFQFKAFQNAALVHGIFMRHGGVSPSRWHSLNVGGTVGDDSERVSENLRRIFATLDLDPDSAFDVWQVHSADIATADAPRAGQKHVRADIILTRTPGVALFMRFADCVPIYLYDPRKHAIGLAHAGWLGTVKQAARVAVEGMTLHFGSKPGDLVAGIGPAIGLDHYEIGGDVISAFRESFGQKAESHLRVSNSHTYLDLAGANQELLKDAGVEYVERADICTACAVLDWYSHRAEGGATGRFGALLCLNEDG